MSAFPRGREYSGLVLDTLPPRAYNASVITEGCQTQRELIELRREARYWRALHGRAAVREAAWKEKARELEGVVRRQEITIAELAAQVEALKARIVLLNRQVFGRKSEATKVARREGDDGNDGDEGNDVNDGEVGSADASAASSDQRRRRGKQPGTKGYGRRRRTNLPAVEVPHVSVHGLLGRINDDPCLPPRRQDTPASSRSGACA